ncbi:MAG TPA: hypothetical protein DCR40_02705 [Prolixibacteraceae bacterium]|nr:hypothetical protein [Prolixibacteraceae bacterium]
MKNSQTPNRGNRYVSWFLRTLLLLVALFFMLFSFDVFSMDGTLLQKLGGFLMHNLFTIFILFVLWLAWKHENLAGVLLIGMSVFMVFFFGFPSRLMGGTWLMISLPFAVGLLFLANYYLIGTKKS